MAPNNTIQDLFSINGIVAVVTGGGSGLGAYAARALDANGAKAVYVLGRREASLKEVAETAVNKNIIPIQCDVTSKSDLKAAAARIQQEQRFVNFLLANSGIAGARAQDLVPALAAGKKPSVKEFADGLFQTEPEDFSKVAHVNVTGSYFTALAFLELLDAGNKNGNVPQDSQIVITSSVAGYSRFLNSSVAYSTSKAAVNHLTKMLSTTFATQGFHIRCNAINPGLYPSEMTAGSVSKLSKFTPREGHEDFSDAHVMPKERSPAKRTGSEQDFAGTILFMASRAGAYLNGETMISDCGRLGQLPATY